MTRNLRIALDFAAGVPATTLAEREGISLPRIYQVVDKVNAWCGAPKHCGKEALGLHVFRRLTMTAPDPDTLPETPEAFYWQQLHRSDK